MKGTGGWVGSLCAAVSRRRVRQLRAPPTQTAASDPLVVMWTTLQAAPQMRKGLLDGGDPARLVQGWQRCPAREPSIRRADVISGLVQPQQFQHNSPNLWYVVQSLQFS